MAQIKSKQIIDFNQSVDWSDTSSAEIPSSQSIKDQFLAQEQLAVDDFVGNYSSSGGTWSLTLSDDVLDNDPELVTIYVNGIKTNGVESVNGDVIIIQQYGYDIDTTDSLKVHYVKNY
jgi:hypothetical protein